MSAKVEGLKQRSVKAGSWVLIGHVFSQIIRFGGNLVLTRLLVPEMFGVMAIVNMLMIGLIMFSDVGLLQNIVQSDRGEESDYLNTAWTIQIIRGFILFAISLSVSFGLYFLGQYGYISSATAYGNEQLPYILAVMSLVTIFAGFDSIHLLLLNRKLMMGRLVTIEVISQVIGLTLMIYLAWKYQSIWALVIGTITTACIKLTLSHTIIPGERCRLAWDRETVHDIIHFGKWIFLTSIMGFLTSQGDRLMLGGLISAETLGIYTVAFFLATAVKDVLLRLIGSVFFPLLSEISRDNGAKLEGAYYKLRFKIDMVAMFAAGFLYATGSIIIERLYDARYVDAGWILEILSLGLVSVGYMLAGQCFVAIGKPKLDAVQIVIQMLTLYTLMPVAFYSYGMRGAVWAIALSALVRIVVSFFLMKKNLFFRFKSEFAGLPFILLGWGVGIAGKFLFLNYIQIFEKIKSLINHPDLFKYLEYKISLLL
jgi:O-antigen/teichoic acid export membrane protein